jgi:CRP-like cAMP-binding protein
LKEGETATYFFILVEGQLEVIKNGCAVKILEPGDYFG